MGLLASRRNKRNWESKFQVKVSKFGGSVCSVAMWTAGDELCGEKGEVENWGVPMGSKVD